MSSVSSSVFPDDDPARRLIPGAYERNTQTYRQPGSMGGHAYGTDGIPIGESTMSEETVLERQREGGGGVRERRDPQKGSQ